jgi:hypothetical protein
VCRRSCRSASERACRVSSHGGAPHVASHRRTVDAFHEQVPPVGAVDPRHRVAGAGEVVHQPGLPADVPGRPVAAQDPAVAQVEYVCGPAGGDQRSGIHDEVGSNQPAHSRDSAIRSGGVGCENSSR